MKRKSFTVTEALITVVILAILASAGIVTWGTMIEKTNLKVCEQNELILKDALKFYIADNDAAPVSLSQLTPEYTDFAVARLRKDKPHIYVMRKIYLCLININEAKIAWAKPSFKNYVGANAGVTICPKKTGEGLSYGFNKRLEEPTGGRTVMEEFEELESNELPIICDCNNATFSIGAAGNISGAAFRHSKRKILTCKRVAVATGGKDIVRIISDEKNWPDPEEQTRGKKYRGKYPPDDDNSDDYRKDYPPRRRRGK